MIFPKSRLAAVALVFMALSLSLVACNRGKNAAPIASTQPVSASQPATRQMSIAKLVYFPQYNPVTIYNTPAPSASTQPTTAAAQTTASPEQKSGVSTGTAVVASLLSFGVGMAVDAAISDRNDSYPYQPPKMGRAGVPIWATPPGIPSRPLVANPGAEGYGGAAGPTPYHGYYYRIPNKQGSAARGGAKDYVQNGEMTGGFALIAYPAEYRNSGVMTFVVNQSGVVYQKDLGDKTAELAMAMDAYNPDKTWAPIK